MSKIIDKAFDASKKIIRSIFKGSPNLITSADLNRQMEAFKYQLDQLDDKTAILSDMRVTFSLLSGTLHIKECTFSYIRFKGCSFLPATASLDTNLTNSAPTAYFCLIADKKTVTYDEDSTHDIAGAKFSDGTSMPAANQVVYENEQLVLTHAPSSLSNLVGIVGVFQLSERTGNVIYKSNTIIENTSLSMRKGVIEDIDPDLSGSIFNGRTYDEAFSILENRANNLVTDWRFLTGTNGSTDISFRIRNGVMYLNLPAQKLSFEATQMGKTLLYLGYFPSDIGDRIKSMFSSLNMVTYNKFNSGASGSFIPYGEFGAFPIFTPYVEVAGVRAYPKYGLAKISLVAVYNEKGVLLDLGIAVYVDHYIEFASDGKVTYHEGPVDWLDLRGSYIYVPRIFGVIPLPGKYAIFGNLN